MCADRVHQTLIVACKMQLVPVQILVLGRGGGLPIIFRAPKTTALDQGLDLFFNGHALTRRLVGLLPFADAAPTLSPILPAPSGLFFRRQAASSLDANALDLVWEEVAVRVDGLGFGMVVDPASLGDPVDGGHVGMHAHPASHFFVFCTSRDFGQGWVGGDVLDQVLRQGIGFTAHEQVANEVCAISKSARISIKMRQVTYSPSRSSREEQL